MKINIRQNRRKIIIPIIVLCLVISVLLIFWFYRTSQLSDTSVQVNSPENKSPSQQAEQSNTQAVNKADFQESTKGAQEQTTAPVPTSSDAINLSAEQSGNSVTIFTKLSGFSSGECKLSITSPTSTYNASAAIIYQPSYSICAGFTVPISNLGTGQWKITLFVTPTGGNVLEKSNIFEVTS